MESTTATSYLSYNGEAFDFPHLRGRAQIVADIVGTDREIVERIDSALSSVHSDDLKHDAWASFGQYTSLEDVCSQIGVSQVTPRWQKYEHGLNADEFRLDQNQGDPYLTSSDVAQFGEHYLNWSDDPEISRRRYDALEDLLRAYAVSDVIPLFELADKRPYK
ncbi:hypothetical protein [Halogeometricum luteum]|uniref:Uncharacterized protein n=1 Tax=Halogeometricum luteum TaxID=2950537 RepID=A0ABU2G825_9EURY|nr:hypothetical protein [Halogeometricum sp. S3BR5-2]MDS0296419.1 hypothetical protein [Halogeometricum sp. S3BR5-2]